MIQYSIVTAEPDDEPVTPKEVAAALEYTGTAKLPYIASLIKSARMLCEAYCGLSFLTQTRRVKLDYFPCKRLYIELPYGPVQSVTTFSYTKDDDTTVTLVIDDDFILDKHSRIARLYPVNDDGVLDTWPTDFKEIPHPITIEYQTGYDDVSGEPLPEQVKIAIMEYCAEFFENRGDDQGEAMHKVLPYRCMVILDSIKVEWNAHLE